MNETRPPEPQKRGRLPPGKGVPAGERAPVLAARYAHGRSVELGGLLAKGPRWLFFNRGGGCAGCPIGELGAALHARGLPAGATGA